MKVKTFFYQLCMFLRLTLNTTTSGMQLHGNYRVERPVVLMFSFHLLCARPFADTTLREHSVPLRIPKCSHGLSNPINLDYTAK
jgi:hypothetical protein